MRNNKNNIILSFKNIILLLRNLNAHLTGAPKIITLISLILILSLLNIINTFTHVPNVSALDYSSNVGIGFTFNPTLSVSISPSDLIIDNLIPGNTLDSNSINVSVATNAAYGYTLSANVNDENLVHSNNVDTFSSIATNADLASLEDSDDSNIWGYSYKNNIASIPTWSNYSGLSNSVNKVLFNTDSNASGSIDFKIAARASSTQPSGVYTGTINFYTITKPTPMNLAESYFAHGKTRYNGYYTMQDMTTEICNDTEIIGEGSQTELIDIRDNKVYWVTKLADNHCWMTQNLDLDLSHDRPLTSEDTDLNDGSLSGAYAENYTYDPETKIIAWVPKNTTKDYSKNTGTAWAQDNNIAYSLNPGNWYWNGNFYNTAAEECDFLSTSCPYFSQNSIESNKHLSVGNYYNWPAAIASDDATSLSSNTYDNVSNNPQNSICPKRWRMPTISSQTEDVIGSTNEFAVINKLYNDGRTNTFVKMISAPLWFTFAGRTYRGSVTRSAVNGQYWSSTIHAQNTVCTMTLSSFYGGTVNPANCSANSDPSGKSYGRSVRCLAR